MSGRLISYAGLRYYQSTTNGERTKFLSDIQEKITIYTSSLIFFNLELNKLPTGHLDLLYSIVLKKQIEQEKMQSTISFFNSGQGSKSQADSVN